MGEFIPYGFTFKCSKCGRDLKDGDEIVITSDGMLCGNTPVAFKSTYMHKECPTIWGTGFDSYD